MKHNPAKSFDQKVFKEKKISFEEIPNQTKLFIDYQKNTDEISKFYPSKNTDLKAFAGEVLSSYKIDRNVLCEVLAEINNEFGSSKKTFENIEKLKQNDCVAVLTGQQAGLFSGSIYSIYKALSAIKLASKLTDKGIKAVPIFWIASEDHDFEEISKTTFLDKEENLFESKNTPNNLIDNLPVGWIEIDESIENTKNELFVNLPQTEFSKEVKDLLSDSYKIGETYSTAFEKLLAQIFKDFGLILASPLNEDLRKLCSPIYKKAIENSEVITEGILKKDRDLKERNYHSQVLVEEDFFPFFYIDSKKQRKSLRFDKGLNLIKTIDGKVEFTKDDLVKLAEDSPQSLSPNALMRPIVQDYLFPTICYFGGGAEIAYFAQNAIIYETLDRPNTPIIHRSSFTIVAAKHRRTLEKYKLEFKELFDGKDAALAEIIEKYINSETANIFDETEVLFSEQLNKLEKHLSRDEITLANNLANRRDKILWHIKTLRKKFHKSETFRNEVVNRQIESLFTNLLPKGVLQERNLNVLYFINLYGENFIKWLYNAVDTEEKEHQILIF